MMGPLKFRPILKEKVWGGESLRELAGKEIAPGEKIGESWELSDRPGDASVVASGPDKGRTLPELLAADADAIYGAGPGPLRNGRFPLLIKFIHAALPLSVQVHPDDAYAEAHGLKDVGKTECWYTLAPPEKGLVLGVQPGTTVERFRDLALSGRIGECLRYQAVNAGDLVLCPAGTVHASLPPMAFVEIQENSDVTFRLYDWGRVGLDGLPRELHVEQALETVCLDPRSDLVMKPEAVSGYDFAWERLVDCDHFAVSRWRVEGRVPRGPRAREFEILICLEGRGRIVESSGSTTAVKCGDTVLIPACVQEYTMECERPTALLQAVGKRQAMAT